MDIKRNVAANFLGKVWSGALSFLFVPIYIRILGIEAYGLIGFFASLMAVAIAFDLGLATTMNRELARLAVQSDSALRTRNFVRSLEIIYWTTGLILGVGIIALAPWLSHVWLNSHGLSVMETTKVIMLMGVLVFLRWPATLYSSGLMGLQQQVLANSVAAAAATLQIVGAAVVIWVLTPTVRAFFVWQIVAALAQLILLPTYLWRLIPASSHRPVFSGDSLRTVWKFAVGISGITFCSVILTQLDKVLLSRLLPLDQFGYYVFAGSIAGVLSLAAMAMYAALFPAFSALRASGQSAELADLYHRGCQSLSILVIPTAVMIVMFSQELLNFYIRDPKIVANSYRLLSLFATGNTLIALDVLPLALQLAHGWTRLSFYKNVVAVVAFVPLLLVMVRAYGSIGAAVTWIVLGLGYLLIEIPIMHRKLLPDDMWLWYTQDICAPLSISLLVMGLARVFVRTDSSPKLILIVLLVALLCATFLSIDRKSVV